MATSRILFDSWFAGPALFALLYLADYACTIATARRYREGAHQLIVFEGSFELTPYFQKDVDALRTLSPRLFLALAAMVTLLIALWALTRTVPGGAPLYAIALGAAVLTECAIHLRHVRNLFLFRDLRAGAAAGRITFQRAHLLRASATEFLSFAGLYLLVFLALGEWFVLGGALGCSSLAWGHRKLARRHGQPAPTETAGSS